MRSIGSGRVGAAAALLLVAAVCLAEESLLPVGTAPQDGETTVTVAEVPPAAEHPCFPGAYYRKAVSSTDRWTGIEGVVRLPQPSWDPSRRHPTTGKLLDNCSVYMGGKAGEQEVDAGLSWEVIRDADGKVSTERKAFRPFWRVKAWANAPAQPSFYYFPGDVVRMRVETREPGKLTMEVEVLERAESSRPLLVALRAPEQPTTFSVTFDAGPFEPGGLQEFKRVNAIDQVGNEGKGVTATASMVQGAEWHEAWLLRGAGRRLPMAPERFTDMRCPDRAHVVVEATVNADRGGEKVDILGTPAGS